MLLRLNKRAVFFFVKQMDLSTEINHVINRFLNIDLNRKTLVSDFTMVLPVKCF